MICQELYAKLKAYGVDNTTIKQLEGRHVKMIDGYCRTKCFNFCCLENEIDEQALYLLVSDNYEFPTVVTKAAGRLKIKNFLSQDPQSSPHAQSNTQSMRKRVRLPVSTSFVFAFGV